MIRAYDDFLSKLTCGPIPVSDMLSDLDGETTLCGEASFQVIRTVMRLEFAGYQYGKYRKRSTPSPYVREVFSCGHSEETVLGCYAWHRPRKTASCYECSEVVREDHMKLDEKRQNEKHQMELELTALRNQLIEVLMASPIANRDVRLAFAALVGVALPLLKSQMGEKEALRLWHDAPDHIR